MVLRPFASRSDAAYWGGGVVAPYGGGFVSLHGQGQPNGPLCYTVGCERPDRPDITLRVHALPQGWVVSAQGEVMSEAEWDASR